MASSLARLLMIVAALLSLGLLAAACGDDDDDGGSTTETTSQTETTEDTATTEDTDDSSGSGSGEELKAEVGPGFEIKLEDGDGNAVSELAAGTYTIKVEDKSDAHNFHLTGAGVDESTTVPEETETTWTVSFTAGEYTFVCDPHADSMKGSFTVT